jgi:dephospho-CoA kinase
MSDTDTIKESDIGEYYSGAKPIDWFVDKMEVYGGTEPIEPTESTPNPHPSLVILGGSPGVGKTTLIKRLAAQGEFLHGKDYIVISLDNIIENYEPYREGTRAAARTATEPLNFTRKNKAPTNENFAKLDKMIGSLSGVYLQYSNPRLKDNLKNMSKIRDAIFKRAIEKGYNIVYDTTFKPEKDIIEVEILPYLPDTYSAIKVIHVYADVKTIRDRLIKRHRNFLREKTYVRGIHDFLALKFLKDNDVGFKNAINRYKNDRRFQFCEFKNDEISDPFTCNPYTEKAWPGENISSSAASAAPNNSSKKRPAAAAAPNNSSKNMGAKTQRARASSKKTMNMLGPVAPPKSKNANETAEVAVAVAVAANVPSKSRARAKPTAVVPVPVAPSVPETGTTSGRPKRETKTVVRYGQ